MVTSSDGPIRPLILHVQAIYYGVHQQLAFRHTSTRRALAWGQRDRPLWRDRPFDDDAVYTTAHMSGLGHQYGDGWWRKLGQFIAFYIAPISSPVSRASAAPRCAR
jgi:hypothetical protein